MVYKIFAIMFILVLMFVLIRAVILLTWEISCIVFQSIAVLFVPIRIVRVLLNRTGNIIIMGLYKIEKIITHIESQLT